MMKKTFRIFCKILLAILAATAIVYFFFPSLLYQVSIQIERSRAGLSKKSIQIGDIHWTYLEGGQGETIVLLHGFGADKDNWGRLAKFLSPHYHLIVPDIPGFGESSKDPQWDYTVTSQTQRLSDFILAMKLNSFHLGGSSMGGHLSVALAAEHPDWIKSLVLMDPGGVKSAPLSEFDQHRQNGENLLLIRSPADSERLLSFVFYKRPFIPKPIIQYLSEKSMQEENLREKLYDEYKIKSDGLEKIAAGVQARTLILWGDQDRMTHPGGLQILQKIIPKAESISLKNVGHLPMLEQPEKTAELYVIFLKQF